MRWDMYLGWWRYRIIVGFFVYSLDVFIGVGNGLSDFLFLKGLVFLVYIGVIFWIMIFFRIERGVIFFFMFLFCNMLYSWGGIFGVEKMFLLFEDGVCLLKGFFSIMGDLSII